MTEGRIVDERVRAELSELARDYYRRENPTAIANRLGERVGRGSGRLVVVLPEDDHDADIDLVVKFARPVGERVARDGRIQTRREVGAWETHHSDDLGQYLAPVVEADSNAYWMCMPRGERVKETDDGVRYWLARARRDIGDEIVLNDEVRVGNAVRIDGELRLCDYGV